MATRSNGRSRAAASASLDAEVKRGRDLSLEDVVAFVFSADEQTAAALNSACVDRLKNLRKVQATIVRATVKPGDTVRLSGLRPQALNGIECTVVRKNRTKIVVRFPDDVPAGLRFRAGSEVNVPASCCEVIK